MKILLATDLASRCDRALDRAVQLAEQLGAELIAACVMDPGDTPQFYLDRSRRSWRRIPDPTERMRWRLKRDLSSTSDKIRTIVVEGDPAEKLVEIANQESCDLIVTGTARAESLGRMLFGSTVNRVLREVTAPILVVHDRPAGPYRDIVIATDFSDASINALNMAATLFPSSALTLFHGYDIPFGGFIVDRDIKSELRSLEKDIVTKFLNDERIDAALKDRLAVVIEHGTPDTLLGAFIDERDVDLTVIGSHGRGAVFDALIGSTAKRLVETLEGDLLIVRHVEAGQ
jgi:nucleotide-binding universal stress UspA family protein